MINTPDGITVSSNKAHSGQLWHGSTNDVGMNPCWKSNLQWNKQRAVSIQTNREGGRVKFSTKWRPALITMPLYMTTGRLYKLLSMRSESKYLYNFNQSYFAIFTMVSYFLRWTLLKIFSSIPNEQSQQIVPQWGRITCAAINISIEVQCPLLWEFWIYNFSQIILERVCVGSIVNIRNECLFFWVHGGMNRSAEQTNHPRTASRFTRFVCPALRFIPPWTQKKRHSFLNWNTK